MILVTGASGLLGSNLILMGSKTGRQMGAVTNHHAVHAHGVQNWQIDLTNPVATRQAVTSARPKTIIHCAAQTSLDAAEKDPAAAEQVNVLATRTLADIAAEVGARFVYISTDAVFDGTRRWNKETDPPNPLSVYGRTKCDGEVAAADANPNTLIARINIYGWNAQRKQSLAEWMLSKLEAGESFPGFKDVYFCPMLVNDLIDIVLEMVDREFEGLYHICGSERISKYEFGVRIARTFGLNEDKVIPSSVHDSPLVATRALDISMSTDRIAAALGRKMPTADGGLERFKTLRTNGLEAELKALIEGQA